jgi:hypothetical protein
MTTKANFLKVREARETLRKLAKTNPELIGQPSPENERDWQSTLAENEMGRKVQVAFRLDEDLVKRLDRYAKQMEREMPGFKVSRADAVRLLLIRALDNVDAERGKKNPS